MSHCYCYTFESLVVRPSNSKLPLNIVIYRPPSTLVAQFFSDFSNLLTQVLLGKVLFHWLVNSALMSMI